MGKPLNQPGNKGLLTPGDIKAFFAGDHMVISVRVEFVEFQPVTDAQALEGFHMLSRTEGIIPAIESAHAVAGALKLGQEMGTGSLILVNLSGRGDKDVETAAKWFGLLEDGTK